MLRGAPNTDWGVKQNSNNSPMGTVATAKQNTRFLVQGDIYALHRLKHS